MLVTGKRLKLSELQETDWPLFLQLHTDAAVIEHCFDLQYLGGKLFADHIFELQQTSVSSSQ